MAQALDTTGAPRALSRTDTPISAQDWRVRQLRAWDLATATFPALTSEQLTAVLIELDAALVPIAPPALAVLLAETLALWRAPPDAGVTAKFYIEALEEFPQDVVVDALRHVRFSHRYPNAPLPADFRSIAIDLAAPLRGAQSRGRIARKRYADAALASLRARDAWRHRQPVVVAMRSREAGAPIGEGEV